MSVSPRQPDHRRLRAEPQLEETAKRASGPSGPVQMPSGRRAQSLFLFVSVKREQK